MASKLLIETITATAQIMGGELTLDAARIMCADLAEYPEPAVLEALARCRREVRTPRLILGDVIARIDDGRPGADEAWALLPREEGQSAVWTAEMSEAWGVASLAEDDTAARMAFRETYNRLVSEARRERKPVQWTATLGWDPQGREPVLAKAIELKRITRAQAFKLLPNGRFEESAPSMPRLLESEIAGDVAKRIQRTTGIRALLTSGNSTASEGEKPEATNPLEPLLTSFEKTTP